MHTHRDERISSQQAEPLHSEVAGDMGNVVPSHSIWFLTVATEMKKESEQTSV